MTMPILPQSRKLFEEEANRLLKKAGYLPGSIIEAILFEMAGYAYQHVHMSLNEFLSSRIEKIEKEFDEGGDYYRLEAEKEAYKDVQTNF